MKSALNNRLRILRAEKQVSQEALAQAIGVSRKTINTIENGVFVPSTVIALKLSAYFQTPVETIFSLP